MRASFTWIAAVAFIGLGLVSCQNKHSNDNPHGTQESVPADPNLPDKAPGSGPLKLKGQANGLEAPHSYQVQLDWVVTTREPSTFYIVKRSDWTSGRVVSGEQGYFLDAEVEEGKKYLYQVQLISGSKSLTSDWLQIEVPKDKVFDGDEVILSGKVEEYSRLFFKNKVKVSWQGEKLEIKANEIFSDGAVFESFSLEQRTADSGFDGKSGGELLINAQRLIGSLYIRADGQNGGRGLEGEKGVTGEKGTTGPKAFLHWGDASKYPQGAYLIRGYWFLCDPPRPPGTDGGIGGKGLTGKNGGLGGNSAKVLVDIEDTSTGDVFFTNKPGVGGPGGPGGPGGEGGEGGWSGEIDWTTNASAMPEGGDLSLCSQCESKQGARGAQGLQGPSGIKGEDGYQAPFCLKLGKSQMGNCP